MPGSCWSGPVHSRRAGKTRRAHPSAQWPARREAPARRVDRRTRSSLPRKMPKSTRSRMPGRSGDSVRRAVPVDRPPVPSPARVPACPLSRSQVDDREYPDPDDVERVPEQTKAEEPPTYHRVEAEGLHLQQHDDEPAETQADVHAVRADEREEGREKGAVGWAGTGSHHGGELSA